MEAVTRVQGAGRDPPALLPVKLAAVLQRRELLATAAAAVMQMVAEMVVVAVAAVGLKVAC